MTPTGLKWYWVGALHRQRACTSMWLWIFNTKKKNTIRWRNDSEGHTLLLPIKCIFSFTPKTLFLLLFWVSFFIFSYWLPSSEFFSPLTSAISLSLEALAPLAGPLPLGVLAELCLWFTHSVPSGLTGWHKDMEQSWERRARKHGAADSPQPYITERKLLQKRWAVWVKLFEVKTTVLDLWFLWARQKMGDWSGRH